LDCGPKFENYDQKTEQWRFAAFVAVTVAGPRRIYTDFPLNLAL
jgi:hypothetical protein